MKLQTCSSWKHSGCTQEAHTLGPRTGLDLAFTRARPVRSVANHKWEFLWGNASCDVWVALHAGDQLENITCGEEDGSGWWAPQWSPDGQRLAMVSTRHGNVHLWVWDRATRKLRQIGQHGIALFMAPHERPFAWLDAARLLYPTLPAGERPLGMRIETQTPETATREWPKVQHGEESTASVLDSGVPVDLASRPQGALVVTDLVADQERMLAPGNVDSLAVSPGGTAAAVTRVCGVYLPQAGQPLPFGSSSDTITLDVATVGDGLIELHGDVSRDVLQDSIRWSPDGEKLAFLGYRATRENPPALYLADVAGRRVSVHDLAGLDAAPSLRRNPQLEWHTGAGLIVLAAAVTGGQRATETDRRDWWLVATDADPILLTDGLDDPPVQLWPDARRQTFVGASAGALWRIDPSGGGEVVQNLTEKYGTKVRSLTWPAMTNEGTDQYRVPDQTYSQVIFSVANQRVNDYYLADLLSDTITPIKKPDPDADLVAYEPATSTAIFRASDRNGLRTWTADLTTGTSRTLFEANQFLAQIAESEFRQITYTGLDGEQLKAWLLLPVSFEEGRRYPLLTTVYPGSIQGDQPPSFDGTINSPTYLNMQIPAARGYAVLFPSMPLGPEGVTDDPMLRLCDGVLPAVDQAINSGIADPNRLYLFGQSFGGFATYGLITQTHRFHAAVALAGLSNLISLYGQLEARERYTDHPHEDLFLKALLEAAQVRMGSAPWEDLGRYLRNSPIFQVDRVQTPVLIVQGDIDYIAIQQGEEFFTSLYRQGKRARFIRYWGEGHLLASPANIKDFWERTFDWLQQHSGPSTN